MKTMHCKDIVHGRLEVLRNMYNYHFPWLSASIIRGKESLLFSEITLKKPIVDLGCGDGQFAGITFNKKIDFGVDLVIPKKFDSHAYSNWMEQDLRKMRFDDESFFTAVSNSVFEHVDDVEKAISETARILKRGGRLYLALPTNEVNNNFWLYRIFGKRIFVEKVIEKYHQNLLHINIEHASWWIEMLERNGLSVTNRRRYISPGAAFFTTMFVSLAMCPLPMKGYRCPWGVMKLIGDVGLKLPCIRSLLFIPVKILWVFWDSKDNGNGCYILIEAIKGA